MLNRQLAKAGSQAHRESLAPAAQLLPVKCLVISSQAAQAKHPQQPTQGLRNMPGLVHATRLFRKGVRSTPVLISAGPTLIPAIPVLTPTTLMRTPVMLNLIPCRQVIASTKPAPTLMTTDVSDYCSRVVSGSSSKPLSRLDSALTAATDLRSLTIGSLTFTGTDRLTIDKSLL